MTGPEPADLPASAAVPPGPVPLPGRTHSTMHWWPLALGLAFALVIGIGVGEGFAAIVLVCAVIYLAAAVTARPGAVWPAFLATCPILALGPALGAEWLSLTIIGAIALALAVIGAVRGTWRTWINRWQLAGTAVFGAVAVTAYLATPPVAGLLIAFGLVAHAVWDVVHHVRGAVVTRAYAEFCAAFDLVLAAVVLLATTSG